MKTAVKETAMERLDYRINQNGIERRVSQEAVLTILAFYNPHIFREIEYEMRRDKKPFLYADQYLRLTIEYRGPTPSVLKAVLP